METINDYIKQIEKKFSVLSDGDIADNRVAQLMGISRQAYGQLKSGRTKHVSEKTAYQIAALLGLNPAYVLLCLRVESAKTDKIKRVWEQLAKGVSKSAAAVLFGLILAHPLTDLMVKSVYYVKYKCRGNDTLDILAA